METLEFTSIAIIGVILSLALEWIKLSWGENSFKSRFTVIVMSIVLGTMFVLIRDTAFFQTVLGILASASTFYAFFLAKKPSQG